VDQRSDLFSLGSVLYAMCTGRAPFRASGSMAVLKRVCEETVRPIRETNPDVPDWLAALIDRLHAKDPAGRYQTAAEVAELLNRHLAHLQHPSLVPLPVTRPARPPASRRWRMVAALVLLSLIAGVIVLIAAVSRFFKPEDTPVADSGPAATSDPHPFVVLGGKGVAERKFDTLTEAVQFASAGDTIEVRGNGPFVSDGVNIQQRLVIRAGGGFTPSITLSQASADSNVPLLNISAPLVLEGLELRRMSKVTNEVEDSMPFLLNAQSCGSLHIANCSLIFKPELPYGAGWPFNAEVKSISVRNSILSGNVHGTSWRYASGGRCNIENCVSAVGGIGFSNAAQDVQDVSIRVSGNTLVGNCLTLVTFGKQTLPNAGDAPPPICLELSGNVARWDATNRCKGFLYFHQDLFKESSSADQVEELLPRLVGLDEQQNVYLSGTPMLKLGVAWSKFLKGTRGQDLADWNKFWSQKNTGSVEGDIHFQGGDLVTRAHTNPEKLTAEDFRLRPDSAGYRAGKGGKDLGADVDLVGPGPAYERWKKTPAYQKWLKDTYQVK
jgi:hypothetical protein